MVPRSALTKRRVLYTFSRRVTAVLDFGHVSRTDAVGLVPLLNWLSDEPELEFEREPPSPFSGQLALLFRLAMRGGVSERIRRSKRRSPTDEACTDWNDVLQRVVLVLQFPCKVSFTIVHFFAQGNA